MGTRENKFQNSEKLCKHKQNFTDQLYFTTTYEVQHSFSMFGVARNDLFEEIFSL